MRGSRSFATVGILWLALGGVALAGDADWAKTKAEVQKALASADGDARLDAVRTLGKVNSLEAVKLLVGLIDLPDAALQKAEAEQEAFEKDYLAAIDRYNKMVVNQKGMVSTAENEQMGAMEQKMKEMGDRVDSLSQLPREIVKALGKTADKDALGWLLKSTPASSSAHGRAAVARAFGLVLATDPDPVPCLEKLLADKEARVRSAAIDSLRDRNAAGSNAAIVAALEDEAWQVRASAADALGALGQRPSVGPLVARLQKEPGRLREDMDRALAKLTGVSFGADPKAWKGWWETNGAAWDAGTLGKAEAKKDGDAGPGMTVSFFGIQTKSKNILFVLDISGSMKEPAGSPKSVSTGPGGAEPAKGGRKIDVARAELHHAITLLPADANFNLIFYSTEVKLLSPASFPANDANKAKANKFVDGLEPDGGTNIHDALEKAFNLLKNDGENYAKGVDTIFFLTDGQPTVGKLVDRDKILAKVKEWNQARKIRIHTVGVGEHDAEMMKRLAEENGGTYVAR